MIFYVIKPFGSNSSFDYTFLFSFEMKLWYYNTKNKGRNVVKKWNFSCLQHLYKSGLRFHVGSVWYDKNIDKKDLTQTLGDIPTPTNLTCRGVAGLEQVPT